MPSNNKNFFRQLNTTKIEQMIATSWNYPRNMSTAYNIIIATVVMAVID